MKTVLLSLLVISGLARATPPILSATQVAMQKIDPDIKPDHYAIARTDLDGDGKEDVLALMNGRSGYCGSGGCTLFVLKAAGDGFTKVGAVKVVNEPIYVRATAHRGLRDLLVRVRGGGATPGFAALAFDGASYPTSAGEANAEVEDTDQVLFADPTAEGFDKKLELLGVTFHVTSAANSVTITPTGLEADNRPVTNPINGEVTGAEVADLNVDGSPEVYVYARATDGSNVGSLVAYAANKKKSLSQIALPDLAEDKKHAVGYRGGDEFAVVESTFARRFPIYPEDKAATQPTGRIRQFQYKLHAGEAGWMLKVDKVIEF